ncbi:hypothetical protein [Anaeromicropila herbilytica]|uniref:Uncharacterized protein n=1 Tax=Anaeromicropila herbilytica TaxID=2785025 RepID=A0A7R7EM48_9FIRM|nr:hypothetical protein [Anaeromicropila herbilytica]BCN31141.1 hypothetical protein bsdtb5_24360 [Anaeromicropila herbilytica]
MYATVAAVNLYEIRITYEDDCCNVVANCFGRSTNYESQEGNTVLQHDLIELREPPVQETPTCVF